MSKFVIAYRAPEGYVPARADDIAAWAAWFGGMGSSLADLEWTVNAYLLSFACWLLAGAALGDRFGRRRMFCIGMAVFTAASAWAALSPTVGVLIAARAVQGAGAAMVMPLTLTLISEAFPPDKRGMAIGLWGGIAGLAVAGGPVIGGAVVQGLSWHWIFWLNVPVGLAVIPLAAWRLRESFGPRARLDVAGLVLAGAGLFSITWGLVRANTVGWSSAEVIGALAAGAALVGLFAAWERRARAPMLPLALFRRARFTAANGVSFFMYAGLFGTLFLMTQFLQSAQHYTPLQAGIRMLPWTAAAMVISPVAGNSPTGTATGRSSPPACCCRRPAWPGSRPWPPPASATPCSARH